MKYFISLLLFFLTVTVHSEEQPVVKIQTNFGIIVIELNLQKAPRTVENFLRYVEDGFYEGTLFHRVIKNFIIQGGGYTLNYEKKPTHEPIPNEANNLLKNMRGSVAMARSFDPDSATSQFFINVKDNHSLNYQYSMDSNWGYAVFGHVIEGMEVVDKIQELETGSAGPFRRDVPVEFVFIEEITIETGWTMSSPIPVIDDDLETDEELEIFPEKDPKDHATTEEPSEENVKDNNEDEDSKAQTTTKEKEFKDKDQATTEKSTNELETDESDNELETDENESDDELNTDEDMREEDMKESETQKMVLEELEPETPFVTKELKIDEEVQTESRADATTEASALTTEKKITVVQPKTSSTNLLPEKFTQPPDQPSQPDRPEPFSH